MKHGRSLLDKGMLEAKIGVLTHIVTVENLNMHSPLVGEVRAAVEAGDFELARRVAETARCKGLSIFHAAVDDTTQLAEIQMFYHTIYWWAHALVMLNAAERHTGRWNLFRPFLRWRAASVAEECYRVRAELRKQLL